MTGDFSRDTFERRKHFLRVLMQQGRVLLDADWNEQTAIVLHYLQSLARDLIGPFGGLSDGFKIEVHTGTNSDFFILPGNYYVDGILCELEANSLPIIEFPANTNNKARVSTLLVEGQTLQPGQWVEIFAGANKQLLKITVVDASQHLLTFNANIDAILRTAHSQLRRIATYQTQPDYPVTEGIELQGADYLIYLDVWERHLTAFEDGYIGNKVSIREKALGGPDTATRAKVVWQVKSALLNSGTDCDDINPTWEKWLKDWQPQNRGQIKARAAEEPDTNDVCATAIEKRFRGPENQLYRVEIHSKGPAWDGQQNSKAVAATFKWSRDNGTVIFPVTKIETINEDNEERTLVTLAHLGRDDRAGLTAGENGDWVEILDDHYILKDGPGSTQPTQPLLKVIDVDRMNLQVKLAGRVSAELGKNPDYHPLLRRWDHRKGKSENGWPELDESRGALILTESKADPNQSDEGWLNLEDGVQIRFEPASGEAHKYRRGDYWLIPARTATGDVEWPHTKDNQNKFMPEPLPPHGVEHHFAPLAVITDGDVKHCRKVIKPIAT